MLSFQRPALNKLPVPNPYDVTEKHTTPHPKPNPKPTD